MAQFVLIPGAGGDPWYWHLVIELMRERGHSVLAVELPADGIECGLPEYVDAVVDKAGELDDVVLVAQSLGGFTAAMAAARLRLRALAFVNAMIPLPGETPGEWWTVTNHAQARLRREEPMIRPRTSPTICLNRS